MFDHDVTLSTEKSHITPRGYNLPPDWEPLPWTVNIWFQVDLSVSLQISKLKIDQMPLKL